MPSYLYSEFFHRLIFYHNFLVVIATRFSLLALLFVPTVNPVILRSPPTAQRFFRRIQPQKLPLLGLPFVPTVNPVILRSLPTAQRFFRRIQPQKSPLLRLVFDSKLFNPVLHLQPSSPQLSRNPRLIFPFPPFPPAHLLCQLSG